MRSLTLLASVASALVLAGSASSSASSPVSGFAPSAYQGGPGSVWAGTIPGAYAPEDPGPSYVYLPPRFSRLDRYPVVYLLHGLPGDPRIYVRASHLARVADRLIASGARPFIAVMPYGGPSDHRGLAEWAGRWESYVVDDVIPWTDANLPTIPSAAGRVIAGLSAGGFGAVDIGLRHPDLFGTLESWSGYFTPLRDGPFVHASPAYLAAHDPSLLVRNETALLRRLGTRFELSSGVAHGGITPAMTTTFAAELSSLGLRHAVWYVPRAIRDPAYPAQMQHGLAFAFSPEP